MAETVAIHGDMKLVRQLASGLLFCARPECPNHDRPGTVHFYWWSEAEYNTEPTCTSLAYCSQDCWQADQVGPRPNAHPRTWGQRLPPGEYDDQGVKKP